MSALTAGKRAAVATIENPWRDGQRRSPRNPAHDIVTGCRTDRPHPGQPNAWHSTCRETMSSVERVGAPSFVQFGLAIASVFRSPRSMPTSTRWRRIRLLRSQTANTVMEAGGPPRCPGGPMAMRRRSFRPQLQGVDMRRVTLIILATSSVGLALSGCSEPPPQPTAQSSMPAQPAAQTPATQTSAPNQVQAGFGNTPVTAGFGNQPVTSGFHDTQGAPSYKP